MKIDNTLNELIFSKTIDGPELLNFITKVQAYKEVDSEEKEEFFLPILDTTDSKICFVKVSEQYQNKTIFDIVEKIDKYLEDGIIVYEPVFDDEFPKINMNKFGKIDIEDFHNGFDFPRALNYIVNEPEMNLLGYMAKVYVHLKMHMKLKKTGVYTHKSNIVDNFIQANNLWLYTNVCAPFDFYSHFAFIAT